MNKPHFRIFIPVLLLVLASIACGFNLSTANVADAYMAKDPDGNERTTAYAQSDIFYAIVDLANAPDDTQVRAVWTAVNAEGEEPNLLIDDVTTTSGDARLTFNLTNSSDMIWPVGTYKVEIYLNDKLVTTLDFLVQ